MFYIEKLIGLFIFSPMIFILLLILGGIILIGKKWKTGLIMIFSGIFLYMGSIMPVSNFLTERLENKIFEYSDETPDIYVVLGGGSIENINGIEATRGALKRIVKGVEEYNANPKNLYISGGRVLGSKHSESSIYKETMIKLGIPSEDIKIEEESRNTYENAMYIKKEIENKGITNIALITSAIHMPRSMYIFKKTLNGINIIPIKCDYLTNEKYSFIENFLPNYNNLMNTNSTLWEYVGIVYYKLKSFIYGII